VSTEKPLPAAPPSRGRDRELWAGALVILGVVAIFTALFTLTDAALFRGRYIVSTLVSHAGGIRKGDPVQEKGVNIGRVMQFKITPEGVVINLEIEGEYPIPKDSTVEIRSSGLLGGMFANVVPGTATEFARQGDRLPGSISAGAFEQVDALAGSATKAVERMQSLLSDETIDNVHQISGNTRQLILELHATLKDERADLLALTKSLRKSAEGLEPVTTGPDLQQAIKRMNALTERLDGVVTTFDKSSKSLEVVMARVERGEGSLGKLTKDDQLYVNAAEAVASLNKAADELSQLTADIRKQPKKYLKFSVF
jgi:phospholipid/cholesterol/gamma-HCH transport system substrate-binding protein